VSSQLLSWSNYSQPSALKRTTLRFQSYYKGDDAHICIGWSGQDLDYQDEAAARNARKKYERETEKHSWTWKGMERRGAKVILVCFPTITRAWEAYIFIAQYPFGNLVGDLAIGHCRFTATVLWTFSPASNYPFFSPVDHGHPPAFVEDAHSDSCFGYVVQIFGFLEKCCGSLVEAVAFGLSIFSSNFFLN
jgi:hypothetical protein